MGTYAQAKLSNTWRVLYKSLPKDLHSGHRLDLCRAGGNEIKILIDATSLTTKERYAQK